MKHVAQLPITEKAEDLLHRHLHVGSSVVLIQKSFSGYLKLFGSTRSCCLGDILELLNAFTEVRHPLYHCHASRNCIVRPAVRQDSYRENIRRLLHREDA